MPSSPLRRRQCLPWPRTTDVDDDTTRGRAVPLSLKCGRGSCSALTMRATRPSRVRWPCAVCLRCSVEQKGRAASLAAPAAAASKRPPYSYGSFLWQSRVPSRHCKNRGKAGQGKMSDDDINEARTGAPVLLGACISWIHHYVRQCCAACLRYAPCPRLVRSCVSLARVGMTHPLQSGHEGTHETALHSLGAMSAAIAGKGRLCSTVATSGGWRGAEQTSQQICTKSQEEDSPRVDARGRTCRLLLL